MLENGDIVIVTRQGCFLEGSCIWFHDHTCNEKKGIVKVVQLGEGDRLYGLECGEESTSSFIPCLFHEDELMIYNDEENLIDSIVIYLNNYDKFYQD
jgi:hypothetical protein